MRKTYTSRNAKMVLVLDPGGISRDALGNERLIQPKNIEFQGGFYTTESEEEQARIESSQDFQTGMIQWLQDENARKVDEKAGVETVVYSIPENVLKLMNKEQLYDYIEQRAKAGKDAPPWTKEQVLAKDSPVKKDDMIAFAR